MSQTITKSLGRVRGENGLNCHIRYSASANGSNMSANWSGGMNFIGFALTSSRTAPTVASEYQWSQFVPTNVMFQNQIQQGTGSSASDVMSQNAATTAINGREPAFTTLSVNKGGTGLSNLASGQALIGNGTGALQTRAIAADGIPNNNSLITGAAAFISIDAMLVDLNITLHAPGENSAIIPNFNRYDFFIAMLHRANDVQGSLIIRRGHTARAAWGVNTDNGDVFIAGLTAGNDRISWATSRFIPANGSGIFTLHGAWVSQVYGVKRFRV